MTKLTLVADDAELQPCRGCQGLTVRLREGRCLSCYREHLADTIDRDAKDDAC